VRCYESCIAFHIAALVTGPALLHDKIMKKPTSSVAAGLGLSDTLVELEIMILDS